MVQLMSRFSPFCVSGMYFFTIVQALVDSGYTRGDDVRGAPYDWRKAPSKQPCSQNHACLATVIDTHCFCS